jgi:hypothetical protein
MGDAKPVGLYKSGLLGGRCQELKRTCRKPIGTDLPGRMDDGRCGRSGKWT